jgi:hypothetical protein
MVGFDDDPGSGLAIAIAFGIKIAIDQSLGSEFLEVGDFNIKGILRGFDDFRIDREGFRSGFPRSLR